MDVQELILEYYSSLERTAAIWSKIRILTMDDASLDQMARELQQYLDARSCALSQKAEAFDQTQENIIRRICGPRQDKDMQKHIKAEAQRAAWNTKAMGCTVRDEGRSPDSMCSPVDMCTPTELPALFHLRTPVLPSTPRVSKGTFRRTCIPNLIKGEHKVINPQVDSVTRNIQQLNNAHQEPTVGQRKPHKKRQEPQNWTGGNKAVEEVAKKEPENLVTVSEKPLEQSEAALDQAFQLLELEDWNRKNEGLKIMRALAEHHAGILLPSLHDACLVILKEVKNLRSLVSRAAMTTLVHLFTHLQRAMDPEAEGAALVLLHKSGECSQFIKEDVNTALTAMTHCCSPKRVMNALLEGGLNHRNALVRYCAAMHIEELTRLVGASRLLSATSPLAQRFLLGVSRLALDSAQEVRSHARSTLRFLATHKDLINMVDKFLPLMDKAPIKEIIRKAR